MFRVFCACASLRGRKLFEILMFPLLFAGLWALGSFDSGSASTDESATEEDPDDDTELPPDEEDPEPPTGSGPTPPTAEDIESIFGGLLPGWNGQFLVQASGTSATEADSLVGADSADYIIGGNGSDTLIGGAGDDVIDHDFRGPQGNHPQDYWYEDYAPDSLSGGLGDDTIWAGAGDTISGGAGADEVSVFVDRDTVDPANALTRWTPVTLNDFDAGQDTLDVTIEVSDRYPGENYVPTVELRTAIDGRTEVWAGVTLYDNAAHTGPATVEVAPFRVAILAVSQTIALADISVGIFWNEVS